MTANQFRKALKALGLSQGEAAKFLGVSLRTANGWANEVTPVPEAVAMLLTVMIKRKIAPADVN